ncbi:unnamed protein product [Periconia digitata]|uniref:Zn(2)-C6 fungal-type domain-containing protein n=1 Tax=Periconia digitata TaxID=1303443 RepID=A0A9W4XKI6_9PLEO|nr:unnamed protein product [Periconia digitata]
MSGSVQLDAYLSETMHLHWSTRTICFYISSPESLLPQFSFTRLVQKSNRSRWGTMALPPSARTGPKRKTKTGCRTCKVRKIKCDETWPACNCCVKTGRLCDGYGIWGGGGRRSEQRATAPVQPPTKTIATKILIPKARPVNLIGVATPEEKSYFEFYTSRTAKKLPPAFGTNFHHSVVLRASANEPAVLHAMLALSASHKRKEIDGFARIDSSPTLDKYEKFMLLQYSKAIQCLSVLPDENSSTLRTILITCLVFIYIEYLKGDYAAGISHLQSGLRLIRQIKQERSPRVELSAADAKLSARYHRALDDALIVAFERQHIVSDYACRYDPNHVRLPSDLLVPLPTMTFSSVDEAVYYIKEAFVYVESSLIEFHKPPEAQTESYHVVFQQDKPILQGHLDFWTNMYTNTVQKAIERGDLCEVQTYKTLRPYLSMAVIAVATALAAHTQMVYDEYTSTFFSIITQSIDLLETGGPCPKLLKRLKKLGWTISNPKSIGDVGRVPPTYFTALKCRNHRIRHCAIKLLQLEASEGTLDSHFAIVAGEVVRLEEGDYFTGSSDIFDVGEMRNFQRTHEHSSLPESRRMKKVDVELPTDGSDEIRLVCRRGSEAGGGYIRRTYNVSNSRWSDTEPDD